MDHIDALHETSLDRQDALASSPRFVVLKTPGGIRLQLQDGDGNPDARLTIHRALMLLENALEQGQAITVQN